MSSLKKMKVIALDTNGVLTTEVYSASIKKFIESHNGEYTSDVERLVFGSPHAAGGHIMSVICRLPWTSEEAIQAFLAEQKKSLEDQPINRSDGVVELLKLLQELNITVTSYGGSRRDVSFDPFLGELVDYFDQAHPYVNIGAARPGMKEIVQDVFCCQYDEIVFVDDLNRVGEVSYALGAGFIGVPSGVFQRQQMQTFGVPYILNSLSQITKKLLIEIDEKLATRTFWPSHP
jgi:phosphoglycolate phosphatase-like HAD superfamily hydrolase